MSRLTRNTHTGVLSFGNGNCPHITIQRGISISLSGFPVPNHYAISIPKGKKSSFPLQRLKHWFHETTLGNFESSIDKYWSRTVLLTQKSFRRTIILQTFTLSWTTIKFPKILVLDLILLSAAWHSVKVLTTFEHLY